MEPSSKNFVQRARLKIEMNRKNGPGETELPTEDKLNNTIKSTGIDLVAGVLLGGAAGAILGRYSFVGGLGVTFLGHYMDNKIISSMGLGMMAGCTYANFKDKTAKSKAETITGRLELFKDDTLKKLWLDKISTLSHLFSNAEQEKPSQSTNSANNTNTNTVDLGELNEHGLTAAEDKEMEKEIKEAYTRIIAKRGKSANKSQKTNTQPATTSTRHNATAHKTGHESDYFSDETIQGFDNSSQWPGSYNTGRKKAVDEYEDSLSDLEKARHII